MTAALSRIAQVAMHTFQRNADTMVAGFLVRHPDIMPEDVDLVMSQEPGGMRFSIQPKELHVPDEAYRQRVGPEHDQSDEWADHGSNTEQEHAAYRAGHCDGWNACRQAMIDAAKKARPADAMVATLDSMIEQIAVGADGQAVEIHRG